jgi:hypothetical protein
MINLNPRCLPVHCNRDPQKRIGWYGPVRRQRPGPLRILVTPKCTVLNIPGPATVIPAVTFDTEIALLDDGDARVLAIKSADQPIEVWRKVVGFYEDYPRAITDR